MSDERDIDEAMEFDSESGFVTAGTDAGTEPEPEVAPATPGGAAGMDQLRGILLGPLAQELERKMTQLSQRVDGSMLELDRRTADRVDEFETRFREGVDAVVAEVAELREEQSTVLQQVKDELNAGTRSMEDKIVELSAKLDDERARELQSIRSELDQVSSSINGRLESQADALRSELVDRDSLSNALSEIALRLSSPGEIIVADAAHADLDLEAAIEAAARNS